MKNRVKLIVALCSSLAGCAVLTEWPGKWPPYQLNDYPTPTEAPLVRPLVILRFPIAVSEQQAPLLQQHYANKLNAAGLHTTQHGAFSEMIPDASRVMFLKTTYHAMQLGRCLSEREPSRFDLILEPATLEYTDSQWTFANSSERPLPVSAVIDFVAFVAPYSLHTSFGHKYDPILNVKLSPAASPGTRGLIASNVSWFFISRGDASAGAGEFDARSAIGAALPEFLDLEPLKWGVHFNSNPIRKRSPVVPESLLSQNEWQPGKVLKIPWLSYTLDLDASGADNSGKADMELCQRVANLLEQALSMPSVMDAEERRVRHYLSVLSAASGLSRVEHPTEAELSLARKLLAAEVRFLVLQDNRLREIFDSPKVLESYERTRAQEATILRVYQAQSWQALATMTAGTVAGLGGNISAMNASTLTALEMTFQADSEAASKTFTLENVYEGLADFSMHISIEGKQILASTHEELRRELGQLFRSRVTAAAER